MQDINQLLKQKLLDEMHVSIRNRIDASSKILDEIQQSIDAESQSTAGDKHDTSRELMQQERNKAAQNLQNQVNLDVLLLKLKNIKDSDEITFGSLVSTSIGLLFIGLPLGKIKFNEAEVLCVSGNSPIAQNLVGARVGSIVPVNGQQIEVFDLT